MRRVFCTASALVCCVSPSLPCRAHKSICICSPHRISRVPTGNEKFLEAAEEGNIYTMQAIMSKRPNVKPNYADRSGRTALHVAALRGYTALANWLVVDCKADVNASTNDGSTPLHFAAKSCAANAATMVQKLLHAGADSLRYVYPSCSVLLQ